MAARRIAGDTFMADRHERSAGVSSMARAKRHLGGVKISLSSEVKQRLLSHGSVPGARRREIN